MTLDARIGLRLGSLDLQIELTLQPGEVVALLGPNGAGKSTVLRCLAGLAPMDDGQISIDGAPVDDPGVGVFVEPEDRPVGFVFQDYALFEHMSVIENVAFGLRARRIAEPEVALRVGDTLDLLRIRPVRLAITGSKVSPPLFESMELLGRESSLARLERLQAVL